LFSKTERRGSVYLSVITRIRYKDFEFAM
jgi:hypothetical protein